MTANRVQASLAQQLAASTPLRRRSVPPSLPEPISESLHQRWRERPRCPASRVTPGSPDGVVHAIVGRAVCHVSAQRVRQEETWRPPACVVVVFLQTTKPTNARAHCHAAHPFLQDPRDTRSHRLLRLHHRVFDSGAVLGIVTALRYTSTRPTAGPAGIDDACARHDLGYHAVAGFLMARASSASRREGC
jgi:hypothetical protein